MNTACMGRIIDARTHRKRRTDRQTAERVDLAVLTARAFDLHSATNYLRLSGIPGHLIESFAERYPNALRTSQPERVEERRRPSHG
jgi:hypothetical protein